MMSLTNQVKGTIVKGETKMLVLSRRRDESIVIGDDVEIVVVDIRGDKVRLGINAPKEIPVHRLEVYNAIKAIKAQGKFRELKVIRDGRVFDVKLIHDSKEVDPLIVVNNHEERLCIDAPGKVARWMADDTLSDDTIIEAVDEILEEMSTEEFDGARNATTKDYRDVTEAQEKDELVHPTVCKVPAHKSNCAFRRGGVCDCE